MSTRTADTRAVHIHCCHFTLSRVVHIHYYHFTLSVTFNVPSPQHQQSLNFLLSALSPPSAAYLLDISLPRHPHHQPPPPYTTVAQLSAVSELVLRQAPGAASDAITELTDTRPTFIASLAPTPERVAMAGYDLHPPNISRASPPTSCIDAAVWFSPFRVVTGVHLHGLSCVHSYSTSQFVTVRHMLTFTSGSQAQH